MPWDKQFDEDAARERAMATFWAKGYKATTMQELLDAMGIQRGSFYSTFGSKREILLDSLRRYDEDRLKSFARLRMEDSALKSIDKLFRASIAPRGADAQPKGCFLVASASELAPDDPEVADIVNRAFRDIEGFLRERIERAKAGREIAQDLDAEAAAHALLGMLLGVRVLARSGASRKTITAIAEQAMALLSPNSKR